MCKCVFMLVYIVFHLFLKSWLCCLDLLCVVQSGGGVRSLKSITSVFKVLAKMCFEWAVKPSVHLRIPESTCTLFRYIILLFNVSEKKKNWLTSVSLNLVRIFWIINVKIKVAWCMQDSFWEFWGAPPKRQLPFTGD